MLRRQLERQGYQVETAANGREALDRVQAGGLSLVLLDIIMPELDGYQVLETLKSDAVWHDLPVIMISALDEISSVARCIERGAEDYLPKPFDPVLLRARIGASLEKKHLRDEDRRTTAELALTLQKLRTTQDQLVMQEKLASLGALVAGIAHEIKNPLNFVINFALESRKLTTELRDCLKDGQAPDPAEIKDLLDFLEQNVAKIAEHGKRADSIVRNMLLHSRGGAGERQLTDINALLAEYVRLAYHGLRTQDQSFNLTFEEHYDPAVGSIEVVTQELSRVFLNIANNACYASHEKAKTKPPGFVPKLTVRTRNLGDRVEVRIRDNGNGVPRANRDKIFQPFFTTKPAGSGTGLGLSLSFDIVVRMHQGELRLESEEGEFAEFIIVLPRQPPAA